MVNTLPDGVFLTSIVQEEKRLEINGSAESNTRVSAFMRNIDGSEWVGNPDLEVVEVKEDSQSERGRRASEFTVFAIQRMSNEEEEDEFDE